DPSLAETRFASSLIANAGGNPLFLEETVRMLRDRGLVDAERWQSEEMGELPVPTSVQGLISSRLDRLEGDDKRVAHDASVVGATFWAGALAHLGAEDGSPPPDLHSGLETLERRDFVLHSDVSTVEGEDEYAFKHILMRDVAYGQVPKGRRAELHVRFSDWVEILPGSAVDEFVEIVAWHLEQACRLSREVARAAPRAGRADVECEALLLLGDIDQRQGRAAEAHRRLAEAQSLATRTGNAYLRSKVAFVLAALVADFDGEHDRAIESLRAGIATAEEIADTPLVAEGHLRLAAILTNRGDLAGAENELRRCLELARDLGSHRVEAEATSWLGIITYYRGDPDEGERLCRQARQWFERTGDTYFQVQNLVRGLAVFALADDRPDEAETWLREAVPVALQIGGW